MDAITTAIYVTDLLLAGVSLIERYGRLASGIAAKAESENRDVTDEEFSIIKAALLAAEKARKGQ